MLKTVKPFIALTVLLMMLLSGMAPASAVTRTASDPFVKEVLRLINEERAGHGLSPVVWNQSVGNVSQQWAEEQNNRINRDKYSLSTIHRPGYGSQQIPDGYDWYTEIIGINNNAQQIVDWWMNSPVHKAGMLSPSATDIGIGYMKTTKSGWYGMYVVVANIAGYPETRAELPPHPGIDMASFKDGDIAAVDSAGNLYAYPTAFGGDLWRRSYIASGFRGALEVEVADWNADGIQDIVARWSSGKLTVHYGLARGGLAAARTVGSSGWANYDITVTDWKQGDLYPAIVAKNQSNGRLYYYNNPYGERHGSRLQIGASGWANLEIFTLDFDYDSRMDLVAKTPRGQLKLYRTHGNARFVSEYRRIIGASGWNTMHHLSSINNHLGNSRPGILARDKYGNLHHYPVSPNQVNRRSTIGQGGWDTLMLGS